MKNLGKLLKQKTSVDFRWRGPGLGYAKEVVLNGDHPEHYDSLAPARVLELAVGGQPAMREFAEAMGYTGLEDVEFYIEPGIRTVNIPGGFGDEDYEYEAEVFRLIARGKTTW